MAGQRPWDTNYNTFDEHAVRRSEEFLWRTRIMHQSEALAANQMIIQAREVKTTENKGSASSTTKQIWNKIALLHWDDLMDIGLS